MPSGIVRSGSPSRRLAAIMFSDIVGYTAMMGEDELRALEILRQSRKIQKTSVEKYGGTWLKEMGDGVLAQFDSGLDAVQCALEIQKQASDQLDAKIRIGLHLGDVTIEEGDVFGDGVNIASRIQSIADPGGIYVSEAIINAVRGVRDIYYENIGMVDLKNVSDPVNTYFLRKDYLPRPDPEKIRSLTHKAGRARLFTTAIVVLIILTTAAFILYQEFYTGRVQKIRPIAVLPVLNNPSNTNIA